MDLAADVMKWNDHFEYDVHLKLSKHFLLSHHYVQSYFLFVFKISKSFCKVGSAPESVWRKGK